MDAFVSLHIPKQNPRIANGNGNVEALITSYPPLGQVTLVSGTAAAFVVSLNIDRGRASEPWEVALWHSNGNEWRESPLKSIESSVAGIPLVTEASNGAASHTLYFTATVDVVSPMSFTLKFRAAPDQSWKWINDQQGTLDGIVLSRPATNISGAEDIHDLIKDLNPIVKVNKVLSQSPNTTVWSAILPVQAVVGEKSAAVEARFGLPWAGEILRWFALVRIWSPWLGPRQGKRHFALDKDAVICSFMEPGGRHLVLLAISGVQDVMTLFKSDQDGNVVLSIRNDRDRAGTARVVIALGSDFESANAAAMYHARSIIRDDERASGEERKELQAAKDGVKPQWMENWFDGLTYCTWNGLGQRLTDEKIFAAVDTLAANNINITNLIIDDNWQSIDYRGHGQFQHGWIEFEADKKAFPHGLKHAISKIRKEHKHIQHIAVWHAMLGYWAGLAPDGKIAEKYKTTEVVRVDSIRRNLPMGGKMTVVAKEDVFRMYDDFYRFLSDCGIDAVKTDAQFMLDTLESAKARCDLFTTYLDAWTISSLKHFSIKAISCMSQTPQILFHSQMPQNRPAILVRNSDDFFPDVESSHPWHIFANAHNSLLTQHLNLLPDWDMFQTVHSYSGFHAAARCISGGPVYITDVPGQHDVRLINQMTGQTPRGRTVIFRPNVGKSLDAYVGYDDEVLLKVGTYYGQATTGTSFIGLFNISQRTLTELLPLSRFIGVVESQQYIIRSHRTRIITKPMRINDPFPLIDITLQTRGYDILSAFPLWSFTGEHVPDAQPTRIANLGLLGKMTGAAAIITNEMTADEKHKITIDTSLKALGVLGLYISTLPRHSIASDMLITIFGKVIPEHTVSVSKSDPKVLEIDLATAWKEMDLDSGWSNEVSVKIYVHPPSVAPATPQTRE